MMEDEVREAVKFFWRTRKRQGRQQIAGKRKDQGARSLVTGGKQMDGFRQLICEKMLSLGVNTDSIFVRSKLELPGWFRAEKKWDIVVVHRGELVAAIELKSQVGPSFGNNFNNRSEEAIGSATDLLTAYREGAFRPSAKPWLGYLMLLEDCTKSSSPVSVVEPHFPVFREFAEASYAKRYQILVEKLLRERMYDSACFLTSPASAGRTGQYAEPHAELTFDRLCRSLVERLRTAIQ